jgi:hypothetical protein
VHLQREPISLGHLQEPRIQRDAGGAGLREATVTVRWTEDDVEFYHRVINAISASRGFRGVETAALWQPFHDSIFDFHGRMRSLQSGQRISIRASAYFDPTVYHGQVTNGRIETEQDARIRSTTIAGVLAPRENFQGRSITRLGLAEVADLSFTATPARSAESLGGLQWVLAAGDGNVVSGNDGRGVFTAGSSPGGVRLELRVVSGLSVGRVVADLSVSVVAPHDAVMRKDARPVKHTRNTSSVGFCGETLLRPADVSFSALDFREGATNAIATGYMSNSNGRAHPVGSWFDVEPATSGDGSKVDSVDSVRTADRNPPYGEGDFLWSIPWQYHVGTDPDVTFTIADQHATSDDTGRTTIEKKGAGPFAKNPPEPTVDYDCY